MTTWLVSRRLPKHITTDISALERGSLHSQPTKTSTKAEWQSYRLGDGRWHRVEAIGTVVGAFEPNGEAVKFENVYCVPTLKDDPEFTQFRKYPNALSSAKLVTDQQLKTHDWIFGWSSLSKLPRFLAIWNPPVVTYRNDQLRLYQFGALIH